MILDWLRLLLWGFPKTHEQCVGALYLQLCLLLGASVRCFTEDVTDGNGSCERGWERIGEGGVASITIVKTPWFLLMRDIQLIK